MQELLIGDEVMINVHSELFPSGIIEIFMLDVKILTGF